MALKADKRNLERNTIPEDICWESRDDVERLTNKQLRLYLRQEGLMVSGNKAQLVERILKHADGSVARTFDEDIEDDDENMPSSSHDDTSSDSESNLPSRRRWTRSYFNFNSGGVQLYLKAYFANFRTPPPDNYCTVPYPGFIHLAERQCESNMSYCKTPRQSGLKH